MNTMNYNLIITPSHNIFRIKFYELLAAKVTIRPDFIGRVRNYDSLFRENYEVSRDAALSRIPSPVPILSRFECNVTSHLQSSYL